MITVFDCFTFFNELDLLEFRLTLLDPYVDKFVICESNYTHSGKTKPYHFNDNKDRFKKWEHKILYIPIEQSIDGLSFDAVKSYTPTNGSWILENQQRLALAYAADVIKDNDIVLVGDLDEIPNPEAVFSLRSGEIINNDSTQVLSLSLLFHYYYMNCQMEGYDRIWNGTVACTGKYYKKSNAQSLRDNRNHFARLPNAGWHFSYLGGLEKIKTKIESFAHTEFNREDIKADENILEALEKGVDIFKRHGISYKFVSLDEYPDYLKALMLNYPQFIKNEVAVSNL
jgi:beta-1,4-mannosyl-glycoprotein beta-1,4-N-acetylglucosaminyltransferase